MEGGLDDHMYHQSRAQGAGTLRCAVNSGLYLQVVLVARTRQGSRSILSIVPCLPDDEDEQRETSGAATFSADSLKTLELHCDGFCGTVP